MVWKWWPKLPGNVLEVTRSYWKLTVVWNCPGDLLPVILGSDWKFTENYTELARSLPKMLKLLEGNRKYFWPKMFRNLPKVVQEWKFPEGDRKCSGSGREKTGNIPEVGIEECSGSGRENKNVLEVDRNVLEMA